jgi:hypothetical protein
MFCFMIDDTLDMKQNMLSQFFFDNNRQMERIVRILEGDLKKYCNYEYDIWSELFHIREYVNNNSLTTKTGITPFLVQC